MSIHHVTIQVELAPREAVAIAQHHAVRNERAEVLAFDAIVALECGRLGATRELLARLQDHVSSRSTSRHWNQVVESIARQLAAS